MKVNIKSISNIVRVSLFSLLLIQCYSTEKKYTYSKSYYPITEKETFSDENPQFESGEPYIIIDTIGSILGFLPKVILLSTKAENHNISEESKQYLKDYMKENNLDNVKVRFNQYAPIEDLKRLYRNERVNPFLKYSLGLLLWTVNAIFPERLFAGIGLPLIGPGDHFNPYTNTINVYSDLPVALVHEGGHAKDFALRKHNNWYALGRFLFPVALYQEAKASDDALRYFRHKCQRANEINGYKQLSPAYATYVTGTVGATGLFPFGFIVGSLKAKKASIEEVPECEGKEN